MILCLLQYIHYTSYIKCVQKTNVLYVHFTAYMQQASYLHFSHLVIAVYLLSQAQRILRALVTL